MGFVEQVLEDRLERFLEPRLEDWFHRFMTSPRGEALIACVLSDVVVAWMQPGTTDDSNYLEQIVLNVVKRLKDRPWFREKLLAELGAKVGTGAPGSPGQGG